MNPDKILHIISRIEQEFEVEKIMYKGQRIWPLLREQIGFRFFFDNEEKSEYKIKSKDPSGFLRPVASFFYFPVKAVHFLIYHYKCRKSRIRTFKTNPPFAVFAYPDSLFIDKVEDKKYSRYIDPYVEVINKKGACVMFGLDGQGKPAENFYNPMLLLDSSSVDKKYYSWKESNTKKEAREKEAAAEKITELNLFLKAKGYTSTFDLSIIDHFERFILYEEYFTCLLKGSTLKIIFLECYYETVKYALVAACKKTGIKTVDIQHGGAEDFMYVEWRKMDEQYTCLPDYLWCWSEKDVEIVSGYNKDFNLLRPIIGGNMWMKKFIKNEFKTAPNEVLELKSIIRKYKKTILLSLQHGYGLSEEIYQAIINSDPAWLWLIRFHPLTSEEEKKEVAARVNGIPNLEIKCCNLLRLYEVLSLSDVQVTYSSTTAIEAISFNVCTILTHQHGFDYYKELINEGVLIYADTFEKIINSILLAESKTLNKPALEKYMIKFDEKYAFDLIEKSTKAN